MRSRRSFLSRDTVGAHRSFVELCEFLNPHIADTLLCAEGETKLILESHRDNAAARNMLLMCNLRLLLSVVKRYLVRGLDPQDLFQLSVIEFFNAIVAHDCRLGTRLSTSSWVRLKGALHKELTMRSECIVVPQLWKIRNRLSPAAKACAYRVLSGIASLDTMSWDNYRVLSYEEDPHRLDRVDLKHLLKRLRRKQRIVVWLYLRGWTHIRIARLFGMTEEGSRIAYKRAEKRLREMWLADIDRNRS